MHSMTLESDEFVTSESFDCKFMDRARVLLNTFRQFKTMADTAIEEENAAAACGLRKTVDNEFTHDRSTFPQTFTQGLSESLREY